MTTYISDIAHYNEVLARVASVKHSHQRIQRATARN